MPDAKAFTGVALSDSLGGSVLVRINVPAPDEPESEWLETVAYDEMSDEELVNDAMADITDAAGDPASIETEDGEYVSVIFDEEEQ